MEDYNTATLPSEKYYDLEKWLSDPRNQTRDESLAGLEHLTDEERLRLERQREMEARAKAAEEARVHALMQRLREDRGGAYEEAKQRYEEQRLHRPTFESIAKEREQRKLEKEQAWRKRY